MKAKHLLLILILLLQAACLHAQIVGANAYIKATGIELGINGECGFEGVNTHQSPPLSGMHFRSNTKYFGFVANPQNNGWSTFDGDFFTPGEPENGWGITIPNLVNASANCADPVEEITGHITKYTHVYDCYSVDWEGELNSGSDLHFKINYLLQENALYYTTTVFITNRNSQTIPTLYYYRNVDPDNNVTLSTDYKTHNTIVAQPGIANCNIAHISATQANPWSSYLGFAAAGDNWRASYGGFSNRNGEALWTGVNYTQTVGSTSFKDDAIALSYKIQNLDPGETEVIKFVVILDASSAKAAIDNLLYVTFPGSSYLAPSFCTPNIDTAYTCGTSLPISVSGTVVGDYSWVWEPSEGLNVSTGSSVVANPAATTLYTIHGTPIPNCLSPVTLSVVVKVDSAANFTVSIDSVGDMCQNAASVMLTADTIGGIWSGSGIISDTLGLFNPSVVDTGSQTIVYTIIGKCMVSDTISINVIPQDNPAFDYNPTLYCYGSANPSANITGGSSGTFVSNPPGLVFLDTSTGLIDIAASSIETYQITFTTNGACPSSASATIIIDSALSASFNYSDLYYCTTQNNPSPLITGHPTGLFSVSPVGLTFENTSTGEIDLSSSAEGTYIVTYTISATGACAPTSVTDTVIIKAAPKMNPVNNVTACNGDDILLTAFVSTPPGALFSWTNSNSSIGLPTTGTGDIAAFTAVNNSSSIIYGNISVIPMVDGCAGALEKFIITVFPTPSVTDPLDIVVCNGEIVDATHFILIPGQGTTSWTNSNPAIGLATSGSGNVPQFTAINTGSSPVTATITVTPIANGCIGVPQEYTITVPSVTMSPVSDITVCHNETVGSVTFTSTPSAATFNWTNSNSGIGLPASGTGNIPSFMAINGTLNPITATITVTPVLGCDGIASTFTITVKPFPVLYTPESLTFCNGETTSAIPFTSNLSGSNYTWSNSNPSIGLAASGIGNIPPFTAINTTSSVVSATIFVTPENNGCQGNSETFLITVNPNPTVTVSSDITLCSGNTVPAGIFVSIPSGGSFSWTNSNLSIGLAANGIGNTPSFTAVNTTSAAITATITVTPTLSSCSGDPASYTITVKPIPVMSPVSAVEVCSEDVVLSSSYSCTPTGGIFSWTNSNSSIGLTASGTGNTSSFTAVNTSLSPIVSSVMVTAQLDDCTSNPVWYNIIVNPLPVVTMSADHMVCAGESATLSADGSSLTSYLWTPVEGLSTSVLPNPVATPTVTTTYTVSVSNIYGCYNTGSTTVFVSDITADFLSGSANLDFPLMVSFMDQSVYGAVSWQWDFGNGTTSNQQNPVVTYQQDGTYVIMLIVTNSDFCVDTIYKEIIVNPNFELTIPNVFTPNSDGYNDTFDPQLEGFETFHLVIFNRWGVAVYETNSIDNPWDGTINNGRDAADGVYYYVMNIRVHAKRTINKQGTVTLIR